MHKQNSCHSINFSDCGIYQRRRAGRADLAQAATRRNLELRAQLQGDGGRKTDRAPRTRGAGTGWGAIDSGKQNYETLGVADDARDAEGLTVFSFAEAQVRAKAFLSDE